MALDFTVVIAVRQRFGDLKEEDTQEVSAPFVGAQKDYDFKCPGVDVNQEGILLFQCQGANVQGSMEINGQSIAGGIPASVDNVAFPLPEPGEYMHFTLAQWSGNVMLIHSRVLKETNRLRIRARQIGDTDNLDNFIIDNVVVIFKTRVQAAPPPELT